MKKPTYLNFSHLFGDWDLGPDHPTQGRRYDNVYSLFMDLAKETDLKIVEIDPNMADYDVLTRVHSPAYVKSVIEDGNFLDFPYPNAVGPLIARYFVGASVDGLNALVEGRTLTAINFAGAKHHAQFDHSSGFCVFNDFAIAADIATKDHHLRVAILDIDGHHGDGTENLTADNPDVLTYSVHHYGIFPGTGKTSDPVRNIYNLPLKQGDGDEKLEQAVAEFLILVESFAPDLVFIAAGADGHVTDPLTGLAYSVDGYVAAARTLRTQLPEMPMLIGGAGGYQPDTYTPEIWAKFAIEIASLAADELVTP